MYLNEMWEAVKNIDINDLASYISLLQFLISVLTVIVTFLLGRFFWKKTRRPPVVYYPKDTKDFYIRFSRDIRRAKKTIINSGDGFMLSNSSSLKGANTLDDAFCHAMEKGVIIRRFQHTTSAPLSWYSRLYVIKKKYPDNFHIFMNRSHDSMGSFCVIDQGERKTIHQQQTVSGVITGRGTKPVSQAQALVYGDQEKSNSYSELFEDTLRDRKTVELGLKDIKRIQSQEWKIRLDNALAGNNKTMIDQEIVDHIVSGKKSKAFPKDVFLNYENESLNFSPKYEL